MHKRHRQRWTMVALSLDPTINDMRTAKHAAVNGMLLKVCFQAIGGRTPMTEIGRVARSEEHTSELQSLMRISYAVFCLTKKTQTETNPTPATSPDHYNGRSTNHNTNAT